MTLLDSSKIKIKNTEEFELYYRHRAILYDSDKIFFNLAFFLESKETNTFSEENIDKHIINVIKSNLDREFFIDVRDDVAIDLSVIYHKVSMNGQLGSFEMHERFYEIGSLEGIKEASNYLLRKD